MITLTDSAKKRIEFLCEQKGKDAVRLSLAGGGCAGFKYDWGFADLNEVDEKDYKVEVGQHHFTVDNMSILYLIGSTVDYVEDVWGSAFQVNTPNATGSCGCGESVGF